MKENERLNGVTLNSNSGHVAARLTGRDEEWFYKNSNRSSNKEKTVSKK